MSSTLAALFFQPGTQNFSDLREILTCFGVSSATGSPHFILKKISSTLQHGVDIEFIPENDHFENNEIYIEWRKWKKTIDKAISKYEPQKDYQDNRIETYSYTSRPKNKAVNILFYGPPDLLKPQTSSSIDGLKLILLALLMLPIRLKTQINLDKTIRLFNSFIVKLRFFDDLSLDFSSEQTFEDIILKCNKLVEDTYTDPKKSERQFLDSLSNVLRLLQGFHLRTPGRKNPETKESTRKSSIKPRIKRVANSVRHTSFHSPAESIPDFGSFIEIVQEAGEESIIAIITPEADEEDIATKDEISSAVTEVKSKYWLQNFHESIPWNSRGINPFTRSLLVNWIKSNDTEISLLFGLMLSLGRRIEDVLNLEIGDQADITQKGEYLCTYYPQSNRFTPSTDQKALVETVSQTIKLSLPSIIKSRFIERCSQATENQTLVRVLECNIDEVKLDAQKTVKRLIRKGAVGLAIDRIHLSLEKRLAEITGDDALSYIIAGSNDDMPPVSAYYASYTHQDVEIVYRRAVEDLYL